MFYFPDELKACHILDLECINGIIFVYTNKNQFIFQMFNSFRKTHTHTHTGPSTSEYAGGQGELKGSKKCRAGTLSSDKGSQAR